MKYQINTVLTKEYFSECYQQITIEKHRWQKLEITFGIFCILSGIVIFSYNPNDIFMPVACLVLGVFEIIKFPYAKKKWLANQLNKNTLNNEIEISFDETSYKMTGPSFNTEQTWDGIHSIVETLKGVVIRPQKGQVIYLSKENVDKDAIDFILKKT